MADRSKTPDGKRIYTEWVSRDGREGTHVFVDDGRGPVRVHRSPRESVDEVVEQLKSGRRSV